MNAANLSIRVDATLKKDGIRNGGSEQLAVRARA